MDLRASRGVSLEVAIGGKSILDAGERVIVHRLCKIDATNFGAYGPAATDYFKGICFKATLNKPRQRTHLG